jgi:hypothetical protein
MVDMTVFGWICCPDCGDSITPETQDDGSHCCEPDRYDAFHLALALAGQVSFDADFAAWMQTPPGRFAQHLATT